MSVAKQTVQNMGEDLTMLVGYSLVNKFLQEKLADQFPPEVDENGNEKMNIALEVFSGGVSFLFMSVMMEVIRREEKFIEYLFAAGEAVILVLYARNKNFFDGIKNRVMATKGFKALQRFKNGNSQVDHQNSFVGQVYQAMQTILHGRNSSHDVANTISASSATVDTAINREAHNLKFAEANNKAFHDSILIKTMTGNFTKADEMILKKVVGRSDFSSTPINHEEMNKIREFIVSTDSNGKFLGLTEAFTRFANGLGYLNK